MEKEQKIKSHKDFLKKKVNPILEKLVLDLLAEKPENVVLFLISQLLLKSLNLWSNGQTYKKEKSLNLY